MGKIPFAVFAAPALFALALAAAEAPAAAPAIPAELQLAVQKQISQSLSLQLQMEQARRAYEQLAAKMQAVCAEKGFTLERTHAGDWVCIAAPPAQPAAAKRK